MTSKLLQLWDPNLIMTKAEKVQAVGQKRSLLLILPIKDSCGQLNTREELALLPR